MKLTLQQIRETVRSVLREVLTTTCTKCGYDNPYMDPVDDYVCRQCRSRTNAWGANNVNEPAAAVATTLWQDHMDKDAAISGLAKTTQSKALDHALGKCNLNVHSHNGSMGIESGTVLDEMRS